MEHVDLLVVRSRRGFVIAVTIGGTGPPRLSGGLDNLADSTHITPEPSPGLLDLLSVC